MKTLKKHEKETLVHRNPDEAHLFSEIMRTHQALLAVFNREVGMTGAKLAVMRLLAFNHPKEMGIMELARKQGVSATAVIRQVKEMEAEHLVARLPDPKDGRRNYVRLTIEGARIFEQIHKRAHKFESLLCQELNPDELAISIQILSRVRNAVEKML